ncbi:aminoglycoside phosphotransferase family protein [Kitasatospora purpeofusca]|uniref:aminoglycoside phosphotransferase family protein n=1 Tax=Kitasatospora purpeofusca TaxID=67352 RepID=UPI00224F07CB|nr:aminoglycoside phosphotransferase family protein [Kitasatospora purpeofusca]MCX4757788.1 aminoglycoside phosphotransferase family protein [Kitasatospora purpeofusca]WSR34514.1 aminoglycoside phosphotransferase family protein [Kitasatospora purpeofusca]
MSAAAPGQITVPDRLARNVTAVRPEEADRWLAALPALVTAELARLHLTLDRVLDPGGSLALVAYVHRDDDLAPAVLKVSLRTPGTAHEAEALTAWAGRGAVLLLGTAAPDPGTTVLLLERLHGGIPLRSLAEPKAMLEATSLLHRLWTPVPPGHDLPGLPAPSPAATAADLPAEAGPLLTEAEETAAALAASAAEEFLLHGDFHHGNVLAADRAPWLAIDPRPLVGERAYDLARLTLDRADTLVGSPGLPAAVRRRLHQLAEALEVDRDRLRGWTLVRAVDLAGAALAEGRRPDAELYLEFAGAL